MSLSITKKDFNAFLGDLIDRFAIYGPVEDAADGASRYRISKLNSARDLKLGYGQTVIPPKKFLFPARSDLFTYKSGEILPPKNKDWLLFGINKRDGEGLFYLDKIMTTPIADEDYLTRKEHLKTIIVDSLPPSGALDCDLYFQKVDDSHFLVFSYSEFGEKLISGNKLFGHTAEAGTISARNLPDEIIFHPRLDEIIENSRNHPVWKELEKTCFACGICSYVCPLCYCFELEDKVKINSDMSEPEGSREKRWDSCMLPKFAKVSFKNYRGEAKDRIYNWYYHKFVRMPREYGFPGCVDCGRCTHFCPAQIKYRDVLKRLIADEKR